MSVCRSPLKKSRNTTFVRYLVAMDIPMIGRTAGRALDKLFHGNLRELELAALDYYDFTALEDFGEILSGNIHEWFHNSDHLILWRTLQKEFTFENVWDANTSGEENTMNETKNNKFTGCTIVATGKLEHFTRDGINTKIAELGSHCRQFCHQKTDYLICGEKLAASLQRRSSLGFPC